MTIETGEDGLPIMTPEDMASAPLSEMDDLRRATPVVRVNPLRVVALRANDVERLSSDPTLVQLPGDKFCDSVGIPPGRCRSLLESFMLMTNGERHKQLRGAFARAFSHPVIRGKRSQVRAVADRIVADLPRGETFDFLALCASRIPAEMIAEVLGLPVEKSAWFAERVYLVSKCLTLPYDIEHHDEIEGAAEELYGFVESALDQKRAAPADDLLSLLATDDSARGLEPETLIYQVMGVILAGSDTTRSGFNVTVGHLLSDRSLWDAVQADRDLIPSAIEEALRLTPPVGSMPRFAAAPVTLGEVEIPAGQIVGLSSLSAMRDETRQAAPKAFDLHRTDRIQPHLVFGGGAHRCLGEMLAKIEMEEGLAALLDNAPSLEMVEAPQMLGFSGIRRSTPLMARIP